MQEQMTNLSISVLVPPLESLPCGHVVPSSFSVLSLLLGILAVLVLLILPVGCSSRPVPSQFRNIPVQPQPAEELPRALKPGDIIDAKTGSPISFETLMDHLSDSRVVYVGETHTSAEDHGAQLQIMKGLYARSPLPALAMEMFPRGAQPVLDQYSAGSISEDRFLKDTKWEKVWGYPFQLYQPILSWAHDRGLKLIALNAPPKVVRKIARTGLKSLTRAERKQIASDFHFDDTEHRNYVREEYEKHLKGSITNFDSFYEAQLTWEETMADTLARALRSLPENQQILVLIGNGHIVGRLGVPRLARLRGEHAFKTVVTMPVDAAAQEIIPEIGDFVWITARSEPTHRGRLGIMLRPASSEKGMEILDVIPDGPAARAGVKKGDVLQKIDGIPIKSMDDIHKALAGEKPDHELTLERGGQEVTVSVTIPK